MDIPRVLIVDDIDVNRTVLATIIEDMGYEPYEAENGVDGLKLFKEVNPNILLLDVSMPEMDGFELCQIIKENPATRDIPIIFISAFDEPKDIVKGFSIGGEDYITKPFIPEVVKARVSLHLKLSNMNQELMETNRKLQASINEQVKQMEREKKSMLYALATIAREHSKYDEKHLERIGYNCRVLAQAMQLSPKYEQWISDSFIETIEIAAPLCDIGNASIPREILRKSDKLTDAEMDLVKRHTTYGAEFLNLIVSKGDYNDYLEMSIDIAHFHHENWDGSGYPSGRSRAEIPISAQIVAVISAFCALTERRMYRESFSREEALEILKEDAGKKYNPDIYDICRKISRQLK